MRAAANLLVRITRRELMSTALNTSKSEVTFVSGSESPVLIWKHKLLFSALIQSENGPTDEKQQNSSLFLTAHIKHDTNTKLKAILSQQDKIIQNRMLLGDKLRINALHFVHYQSLHRPPPTSSPPHLQFLKDSV